MWSKDEISQDQQAPQGLEMEEEDGVLASIEHEKSLDGITQGCRCRAEGVKTNFLKKAWTWRICA